DRLWARHSFRARLLELADDLLQSLLNLLHGATPAGSAKIRDSLVDVQAVPRQLVGERYQLVSERPANPPQDREREEDSHEDPRPPPQGPPRPRPRPRRWRMPPTGPKRNVSKTASATGISTACSQYKAATTSATIPQLLFMPVFKGPD